MKERDKIFKIAKKAIFKAANKALIDHSKFLKDQDKYILMQKKPEFHYYLDLLIDKYYEKYKNTKILDFAIQTFVYNYSLPEIAKKLKQIQNEKTN